MGPEREDGVNQTRDAIPTRPGSLQPGIKGEISVSTLEGCGH